MASSNYIGGDRKYYGKVEHVTKTFGFITLDNKQPIARAYFDQVSANMQGQDLTETFSKGTKVSANIKPTDGEHKVKHKAVNVSLTTPKVTKDDPSIRGGDHYLRKYLMDNGPFHIDTLAKRLTTVTDNCPRFLRKGEDEYIRKVATANPDIFQIKNDVLCLTEVEKEITDELLKNMDCHGNKIPIDAVNGIIRPNHEYRKYLHSTEQWYVGIKNFVARNADQFVFWKNSIWKKQYIKENAQIFDQFKKEMAAVKYYSKFVIQKSPIAVNSLVGHRNQADDDVKGVSSSKIDDFMEFLEGHSFFFILRGDQVKECKEDRLDIIDDIWLKTKRPKARTKGRRASDNSDSVSTQQPPRPARQSSTPSPQKPPVMPQMPSFSQAMAPAKAFSESVFEKPIKKPIPCSSEASSSNTSHASQYGFQTAVPAQPLLFQNRGSNATNKINVFDSKEVQIFKKLIGDAISGEIEDELHRRGWGLTLNCLLLLRMNVGKAPLAKFRIPGESKAFNCPLKTGSVKAEDMQKILRQNAVVKLNTPSHYGVKGTLHSIRTLEQDGKVTGLTLFCQLHEDNDGLALDVLKRKKFTAVFTGNYPTKYIYNYLRCRCNELSSSEDVLVLDVDGQLSGHDEQAHASLGDVSRISCSSSSELVVKISDAIQHMHEYVIISGIDSVEQLQPLQKMCSKGTRVLAEVSSDLKSEVESMFP